MIDRYSGLGLGLEREGRALFVARGGRCPWAGPRPSPAFCAVLFFFCLSSIHPSIHPSLAAYVPASSRACVRAYVRVQDEVVNLNKLRVDSENYEQFMRTLVPTGARLEGLVNNWLDREKRTKQLQDEVEKARNGTAAAAPVAPPKTPPAPPLAPPPPVAGGAAPPPPPPPMLTSKQLTAESKKHLEKQRLGAQAQAQKEEPAKAKEEPPKAKADPDVPAAPPGAPSLDDDKVRMCACVCISCVRASRVL